MALFGRGSTSKPSAEAAENKNVSDELEASTQKIGPQDSDGTPVPDGYLDLGALYVPSVPGIQLRAQFESDKKTLRRILLVTGTSGIQVSVAAAPKSGGVWSELSGQIKESIVQSNGEVHETKGRYGDELVGKIPVQLPDGSKGLSPLRILGIEGPRWVARIDIQGAAAAGDEEQAKACYELIDRLIINRGSEPRVRLELLPLRLPQGAAANNGDA